MSLKKSCVNLARRLLESKAGFRLRNFVVRDTLARVEIVVHDSQSIRLCRPNPTIQWRNRTFSTKEPETLAWIDSFSGSSVLWDIGANIGLYSIYAGIRKVRVVAFEPSPFNLEFLTRNVNLNSLQEVVTVMPIAVGIFGQRYATLSGKNMNWGHSKNQFEADAKKDSRASSPWHIRTVGIALCDVTSLFKLPNPSHIKIDVDGIELQILESAGDVLRNVESVLVEINGIEEGVRIGEILANAGLKLAKSGRVNQIWKRI